MSGSTPRSNDPKAKVAASVLSARLKQCWKTDLDWQLIPAQLKEGCHQVGKALSMPAVAVLAGLIVTVGFCMSHSCVEVEATDWVEPVLVWTAICMPTGSGKSGLCKFLKSLVDKARASRGHTEVDPSWMLDDQSFEKMGSLMDDNYGKLLGLYDELSMFLSQINIFRGRGLSDSHELALFLQLYGGNPWVRRTVSGDANFHMTRTGITLGGFIQPSVARSLIELQPNVEKGLCQRFLWLVPQPTLEKFDQLQKVDDDFVSGIVTLMSDLWIADKSVRKWVLPRRPTGGNEVQVMACGHFQKKYDKVQGLIQQVGCMDELSGMLSKSKGQVLRVAAVMHVLFHMHSPDAIPREISEEAVKAADCFVDLCLQHAAYLGGRGDFQEAVDDIQQVAVPVGNGSAQQDHSVAAYCLLLPGKTLHLSALLTAKRFRDKGNKEGAVRAFRLLQEAGLGAIIENKPSRGASMTYEFKKCEVPDDEEQRTAFCGKLVTFGISLRNYMNSLTQEEITTSSLESRKRPHPNDPPTTPRRSPRKQ